MSTMILLDLVPEGINWRASSQIGIPRSVLGSTISDAIRNFYDAYPGDYILYSSPLQVGEHGVGVWAWQVNDDGCQPYWISRDLVGETPESWKRLMETLGQPWGDPEVEQDV